MVLILIKVTGDLFLVVILLQKHVDNKPLEMCVHLLELVTCTSTVSSLHNSLLTDVISSRYLFAQLCFGIGFLHQAFPDAEKKAPR